MDYIMWLTAACGIGFVAYLLYSRQFKWLLSVAKNVILGTGGILAINFALISFGIQVGINALTLIVVGILGLPGLGLLYATRFLVM
ncbi:MAG: pro-sigmaK processing inhibitor BofA family protein [Defluviitaleaceae bacterium]|nr:pro-sigmaK processing inhibitor BofA family protein [Defluviitaleaceae bacterium]